MSIITYEDRLNKIKSLSDISKQMQLAKSYATSLRTKARKAKTLSEKIKLGSDHKEAQKVLFKLRMNVFDIEDSFT